MCGSRACLHGLSALALVLGCGSPAATNFSDDATAGGRAGGGGGGSSGSAGKAGAGGASGGAIGDTGTFEDDEDAIDDMEDGDSQVIVWSGRDGHWYVISDGTSGASTTPAVGVNFTMATNNVPRGLSTRSAGLAGTNFADWGAALVFDFRNPVGGTVLPYDASNYTGLSFYGRSLQGELAVRITVPDSSSHPAGGICSGDACFNHYHSDVTLSAAWRKAEIPFTSLIKDGVTGGSFNRSVIFAVEFVVPGKTPFEFQIDDIAFTEQ